MQRDNSAGLPTRAALQPDGLYLVLKDIPVAELRDPFMHQSVARVDAGERIIRLDLSAAGAGAAPAGIVFHVGRCGSTALSQALKQIGGLAVYSEPLPVNELLSPPRGSRAQVIAGLRALGGAFAAHAGGPYVLKLSSWATLFCDVIAEAFPASPWVFCVRDPLEVGEAILRDPPPWIAGETEAARHIAAIIGAEPRAIAPEQYFARVYAAFCESVLRLDPGRGRLIEYAALNQALFETLLPHFGVQPNAADEQRMRESLSGYAKAPLARPAPFAPDAARKRADASPALRAAVEAIAHPALERVRTALAHR